jgi:hypothetical protein
MGALEDIDKRDLKELLCKGWMTHDAMWFASCYREFGIEKASALNLSAIALMAGFEVERIRQALGMQAVQIDSYASLARFVTGAMDLILPEFMQAEFAFCGQDVMEWKWKDGQCFAYKGLKRIGALDGYRCGVMYRIECWLRALDLSFELEPPIPGCLMHERGTCEGRIRFQFDR